MLGVKQVAARDDRGSCSGRNDVIDISQGPCRCAAIGAIFTLMRESPMNQAEALAFLAANQPMPRDEDLDEDRILRYDLARRALVAEPHPDAARLLLHSFGEGSGFGVYQLVEDALRSQPRESVIEALLEGLRSDLSGVRSWSAEIALQYEDPRLDEPMRELVTSPDRDVRYFAAAYVVDRRLAVSGKSLERARAGADEGLLGLLDDVEIAAD